jgi:hypothetical protein
MKVSTDVKAGPTNVAVVNQAAGLSVGSLNINSASVEQLNIIKHTFVLVL